MDYYAIITEEAERLREENPSIMKGSGRNRSNYGNRRQESNHDDRYSSRNDSYGRSNRDEDDRYGRSRYDDKPSRSGGYGGGGGYGSRNYDRDDDYNNYKGASKWTTAEPETSGSKWTQSDASSGGGEKYGGSYNRNNDDGDRKYGRNDYSRRNSYDKPSRGADDGGYRSYDRGNRQDDNQASKWTRADSDNHENSYGRKNDYYEADRSSRGERNRDDNYQSSKWTRDESNDRGNSYGRKDDYYGTDRSSRGTYGRNKDDNYQTSKWTQGNPDDYGDSYSKKNDYSGSSRGTYGRNKDDNYQTSKWLQEDPDDHEDSYSKKNDYSGSSTSGYGKNKNDNPQTSKWLQEDPDDHEDSYANKNDYSGSSRGKNEDLNDDYQASKWTKNDPEGADSTDNYSSNRQYRDGHDDRTRKNYENDYDSKQRNKKGYKFDDLPKPSADDHEDPLTKSCSTKRTNAEPIYYSNNNSLNPIDDDEKENYSPSKSSIADGRARKKSLSEISNDRMSTHSASKDIDGQNADFDRFLIEYKPSDRLKTNHCVLDLTDDNHYDRLKQILQASSHENLSMIVHVDDQKALEIADAMQTEGIWVFSLSKDDENFEQTSKQHSELRTPVVTYSFLVNNPDLLKFPTVVVNYDFDWKRVKYLERYLRYRNDNKEPEVTIDIYHMALPGTPGVEKLKSLFCD